MVGIKLVGKQLMWIIPPSFVFRFVIYLIFVVTYLPKSFIQTNIDYFLYINTNFMAESCPEVSQLGLKICYRKFFTDSNLKQLTAKDYWILEYINMTQSK